MGLLEARLIAKIRRTDIVESFRFLPENKIGFIAGQFLQLIFDTVNSENKDLNKFLSFSCSPTKEYIEVTKRLSESDFSENLKKLEINDRVFLKAPLGSCIFKDSYKKIGFLIGGIGITPVISIIEYIMDKRLDTDVTLLYSNRTEEDIAFRKELDYWQSINKNIKVFYTITECQPKDNTCIFGRIDKNLLLDKVKDYPERIFFIFGPPKMTEAMNKLCLEAGCNKENIRLENFVGY